LKNNPLARIITSFTLYKFLDELTTPFDKMPAYQRGIIDKNGNQIKPDDELTPADRQVFTDFDRLVISLRRLIMMVPNPYVRSNMNSVITSLKLISEQCENLGGDSQIFMEEALREMVACRLVEDGAAAPIANAMGGPFSTVETTTRDNPPGNIAGYDPPLATGKKIFRRKKPNKYYMDRNNTY